MNLHRDLLGGASGRARAGVRGGGHDSAHSDFSGDSCGGGGQGGSVKDNNAGLTKHLSVDHRHFQPMGSFMRKSYVRLDTSFAQVVSPMVLPEKRHLQLSLVDNCPLMKDSETD